MPIQRIASKRPDSAVDRFLADDADLQTTLEKPSEPLTPLMHALLQLQECLNGKRLARDAIAAAMAVPMEGADPELLILMLSSWAELSCRITRPAQAQTLIHRAKAVLSEKTRPEIRASIMRVESILADAEGDKAACETTLRKIVKMVPDSSPRHKFFSWELSLFLARQGRAAEMESELKELAKRCNPRFSPDRIHVVNFFDAMETGNTSQAAQLLPQIENTPLAPRDISRDAFSGCQALLTLMQAPARNRRSVASVQVPAVNTPIWVRVIRSLLMRDTAEALRLARMDANRVQSALLGSGFNSFNLIRAELAAGNWEAARRLLEIRQGRGNTHYLDDFFLARVSLLASDLNAAGHHLSDVLKSADFYHARKRLDFEIELSCELSTVDIVTLLRPESASTGRTKAQEISAAPAKRKIDDQSKAGDSIVGESSSIHGVRELIERFADIEAPILITGETGTGKELVARALYEASKRKSLPFIAVNCGAIAETILESELFGHERGAFTGADKATKGLFEEAGEGTIFLDEIGEIPPHLQRALLRVLESGEIRAVGSARTRKIRCRIFAATNNNLELLAESGSFRKDLLFRLQRLCIHIPPLRERRDDVPLLVGHFLDSGRRPGAHATLSNEALERIKAYHWPGNVRELKNVIERMRLMHSDKLNYGLEDLDLKFHASPQSEEHTPFSPPPPLRAQDTPSGASSAQAIPAGDWKPAHPEEGRQTTRVPMPDVEGFLRDGSSSLRRLDMMKELFTKHGKMTRNELIRIFKVSPNTATKDLKALVEEGFIDRVEPSTSTRSHYFTLKHPENKKPGSV